MQSINQTSERAAAREHFHHHPSARRGGRDGWIPGLDSDVAGDLRGQRGGRERSRRGGPGGSGFGPGGFGSGGFGPGGFGPGGFPGHGPRGGRRRGRGDVRAAVLLLLVEEPMHGYQLIQEIGERSGGAWRPSPGAVYPALNLLEDEGLVEIASAEGRRLASLTEAGRTYVTEHGDDLTPPWADIDVEANRRHQALREAIGTLAEAVAQVARTGGDTQADAAVAVLERARREVYLVLAQPSGADDEPAAQG